MAPTSVHFPVRTHGISITGTELRLVLKTAQDKLALRGGIHILLDPGKDSFDVNGNVVDEPIVFEADDVTGCKAITKLLHDKDNRGVVHIFRDIPCCGLAKSETAGCSGLDLAILVRAPLSDNSDLQLRAVEWMHELGHNKGLCHNTCKLPPNLLMTPIPGVKDKNLDQCEQNIFTKGDLSDPECKLNLECRPVVCDAQQ